MYSSTFFYVAWIAGDWSLAHRARSSMINEKVLVSLEDRIANVVHLRFVYGVRVKHFIERLVDDSRRSFELREKRNDQVLHVVVAKLFRNVHAVRKFYFCI